VIEVKNSSADPSRLHSLPVELRAEDFALVARATVSTAAETLRSVQDANVYLSVTLPDGSKIGQLVNSGTEGPQSTGEVETLLAKLPSVSAFLHEEAITVPPPAWTPVRDGISWAPLEATSDAFTGVCLYQGTGVGAHDPVPLGGPNAPGVALIRAADAPAATLQIAPASGLPVNIVLPRGAAIRIAADHEDWFSAVITTGIDGVDDLVRLRAAGQWEGVAAVLKAFSATDAVKWLETNPAAGAILGYGLLRTDRPETLAEPFADATSRWPKDPDALVIAAEVAARLGRHAEALTTFVAAIECGLPAFSFGLNYAADRLRAYGPRPGGPVFSAELTARATTALVRVYPFASRQEASLALTCYVAVDPTRPEADPTGT